MTEIQIKNLIKEYEKEYIEFMEIEKLPQYKIDFFEINVEESDAAGFASAAQAYYNTKTDEHILRICKSSEIPREKIIRSYGCIPSFLNYNGYPASICVSVNQEVVHGIPDKHRIIHEGDIVSLDAGVIYKGYHSDAARTHAVGEVSEEAKKLIQVTK